jgi:hypothetical protein
MSDEHLNADVAFGFLREVYTREGSDAAVQAAQDMIAAGAAWITQEHGPDEDSARSCDIRQNNKPSHKNDILTT